MLPKIIGLLGRSRVGKDTVANYIISKFPQYRNEKLAKPIKDAVIALYGFTQDHLETQLKEIIDPVWNITPRQAMIHVTNSTMELMGKDFFTKRLYSTYKDTHIIISDIRYEHDIHEIKRRNGIVIKILRDDNAKHGWEDNINEMNADFTVYNNGKIEDLYRKIDKILFLYFT